MTNQINVKSISCIFLLLLILSPIVAYADINTQSPLPTGQLNVSYSKQVTATSGTLFVSTVVDGEYGDYPGGNGYRWSVSAGSLPSGITLLSTTGSVDEWYDQGNNYFYGALPAQALLTGVPTQGGTYTFTLKALCYGGAYYEKEFVLAVTAQTLSITTTSLPAGEQNLVYSATVNKQGGVYPYTWFISSGSLPAGLNIDSSTGAISGTPTGSGTSNFTVQVQSSDSQTATKNLSINIVAPCTITTSSPLANGQLNTTYNVQVNATGGTLFISTVVDGEYGDYPGGNGYRWSVISGSLPAGVTLQSSTGSVDEWYDQGSNYYGGMLPAQAKLAGTPTQSGFYNFTLKALCYGSAYATKDFSIAVSIPQLVITTNSLPQNTEGRPYNSTLAATGGVTPYTWSIISGTLQTGLTLNASTGIITGTPISNGTVNLTFQVTSSDSQVVTKTLSLTIAPPCSVTGNSPLTQAKQGVAYNNVISATGGTLFYSTIVDGEYGDYPFGSGYRWSVISGSLPSGITLQSTNGTAESWYDQGNNYYGGNLPGQAVLAGTSLATGTYLFTIQAIDYYGSYSTMDFVLVVNYDFNIQKQTVPYGRKDVNYSTQLTADGAPVTYTWSIASGSLPPGLTLTMNGNIGVITGTPTMVGNYGFTVHVAGTDVELNPVAIKTYTMEIRDTWDALTGGDHKGQDWTITSTTTIGGEQYGISSFTIAQGITVTIQSGSGMVINAYDISVFGTLQAISDGVLQLNSENDINIGIDGKVIAKGGTIDGPSKGADSPTFDVGANGGSYGGQGGQGAGNTLAHSEPYGTPYGLDIDTGSKGGNTPVSEVIDPIGGSGGKAVLYAGQNVTIDGEVDVSGEDGENGYVDGYQEPSGGAGGGSGGGVMINTMGAGSIHLSATCRICACGGNGGQPASGNSNGGGGGSGGRAKFFGNINAHSDAVICVYGGYGGLNAQSGEEGTIEIATPLNAPSNLIATAISNWQVNLQWQDNSNDEFGFKIERSIDNIIYTEIYRVFSNVTTFSDMIDLLPNTTYYYRIRAYNNNTNYSDYSNVASITTPSFEVPVTITQYLTPEEETNMVAINVPGGGVVTTRLSGNFTFQITPTLDPDIASFTILHLSYVGTSLNLNGLDSGTLWFSNDPAYPSVGTLNLKTGHLEIVERVLVHCAYLDALELSPVVLDIPLFGTFSPMSLTKGIISAHAEGTIPTALPLLGGALYALESGSGIHSPDPNFGTCPSLPGDKVISETDVTGNGKKDKLLYVEGRGFETDDKGNAFQLWATEKTYRWRYVPVTGTPVWVGACKYSYNGAIDFEKVGTDTDKNGKIDEFTGAIFTNTGHTSLLKFLLGFDDKVTTYVFDIKNNKLTVTNDGQQTYNKPPPTTLKAPPFNPVIYSSWKESIYYPSTYILATSSGPPTWEYQIFFLDKRLPKNIKAGSIWSIGGCGIASASVTGDALLPEFGGWHVKQITDKGVEFEATNDAIVSRSFSGFSITAPNSISGIVFYLVSGSQISDDGIAVGPVGE